MKSYENSPMSPTKRLGVSLHVDTGYKTDGKTKDVSPPQTPPAMQPSRMGKSNIGGSNRALKEKNGPRETFLDDITPVDSSIYKRKEPDRGPMNRDSHDLSLSPRQVTRDSLVDHMLQSLDQFSFGHDLETQPTVDEEQLYSTFGEEEHYQPTQNFAPRNGRGTGHTYSYSSDYDIGDDSSRYSGQVSRRRRSNSSSNVHTQAGIGRANHIRKESIPSSSFNRGPPIQLPPRGMHSRSGKGSKGSSANSFDLGYTQSSNNQRWALHGRSSSFDFGDRQSRHANAMSRPNNGSLSPLDYEAAPTPTVPAGPRRPRPASPTTLLKQQPAAVESPLKLERRRSTRSSKSAYKNKASGASNGRLDYELHDRSRELPPLPAFLKDQSASAPLVNYEKTKDSPPITQPSKERPGFFRRVFGSSRSNPATEPPRSHGSTTSADTADRPNSKSNHIGNQIRTQHATPPRDPPPPPPKEHTHVLTKKPSSFFRRRKKSVSEPEPPVPLPVVPPIQFQPKIESKPEQSPVSSLRKVMNPYLRSPGKSMLDPQHPQHQPGEEMCNSPEDERNLRSFSPSYEPDASATIRAVKPASREGVEAVATSYVPTLKSPTPSLKPTSPNHSPAQKPGYLGLDGQSSDDREATFLQDSSDNDQSIKPEPSPSLKEASTPQSKSTWLGGLSTSSPSVARDMALVAEYERVHSKRSPAFAKADAARPSPAIESPMSAIESKASHTKIPNAKNADDWVIVTPSKHAEESEKETRVYLEPSDSEEDLPSTKLALPKIDTEVAAKASGSTESVYKSATSLPILQIDGEDEEEESTNAKLMSAAEAIKSLDGNSDDPATPLEGDRERAKQIYDGNEDFIQKERAATWLGEEGEDRKRTLIAYMELYDFTNINILAALRAMCNRLVLKAESQQVDRILDAFARRWCQSNPKHGFKATDVVHTICYSILLLNTDLHLADIDQKMTRSQFVKNTMPTIRRSITDAAPDAFEPNRPSVLPGKSQTFDIDTSGGKQTGLKPERASIEVEKISWRSSFKPPGRSESDRLNGNAPTPLDYDTPVDDCGPLVKAPFHGTLRTWEVQVEIVLKDFYNSIRNERLPLFGAPVEKYPMSAQSSSTLSVFTNGMLRRTPSVLSKAPSETQIYAARGRTADAVRSATGKWSNKTRSRPRLYPNSGMGSSRTSLDDQSSMWSPSVSSSTWSKYSLGKTHTSLSVDSLGSNWPSGDYQQSIGFANALSQAIIREETTIGSAGSGEELRVAPLLEDESLELAGAPWAKEGIVKMKHHLEAAGKRARERQWQEVFAVIEKGHMSIFSFTSKSMRSKSKGKASGVVGGGNWQENAESLGSFLLRQTIASALPSPGYSKARPHVFALSLPTGAVHLFQVGTPDIVKEFVSTANYWSARLSNHPLVGGISNIEYGWSDSIVNNDLVAAINEATDGRPSTSNARPSLQSSLRSSLDQRPGSHMRSPSGNLRPPRLPGDKVTISDWTPPTQSMRSSNLMEPDQLKTLTEYVAGIEEDLQKHNQLRNPMLLAFTPRHSNAVKAMANWENKSSYLLKEIVKFRTYIDILQTADVAKKRIYAERAVPEIPEDDTAATRAD